MTMTNRQIIFHFTLKSSEDERRAKCFSIQLCFCSEHSRLREKKTVVTQHEKSTHRKHEQHEFDVIIISHLHDSNVPVSSVIFFLDDSSHDSDIGFADHY